MGESARQIRYTYYFFSDFSIDSWDNFAYLGHSVHLATNLSPWKFIVFDDAGHNVPTAKYDELNNLLDEFWKYVETKQQQQQQQ